MRAGALAIGAANLALEHLADLPEGPEVTAMRERALGYIEEVAIWGAEQPSVQVREATLKNVLALHIAVATLRIESPRVEDDGGLRLGTPT